MSDDENNETFSDNESESSIDDQEPTFEGEEINDSKIKIKETILKSSETESSLSDSDIDEDSGSDEESEDYEKLLNNNHTDYLQNMHSGLLNYNDNEVENFTVIVRDKDGNIVDPLHKTLPFLTKYEKTKIIGTRSKQLSDGADPFIKVPDNIIDSTVIAELELEQKKIPFIVKRPMPGGGAEFWNLRDLDIISF